MSHLCPCLCLSLCVCICPIGCVILPPVFPHPREASSVGENWFLRAGSWAHKRVCLHVPQPQKLYSLKQSWYWQGPCNSCSVCPGTKSPEWVFTLSFLCLGTRVFRLTRPNALDWIHHGKFSFAYCHSNFPLVHKGTGPTTGKLIWKLTPVILYKW